MPQAAIRAALLSLACQPSLTWTLSLGHNEAECNTRDEIKDAGHTEK